MRVRDQRNKKKDEHLLVYSGEDGSSVVEEDISPPSGPASAPSGIPFGVESPTWWKSGVQGHQRHR